MNSDTSTRYGSRVRRHGRSRAARAHQARSLRVNLVLTLALTSDFCLTLRIGPHPFDPLSAISSLPPDLLSHFCPHPRSEEHTSELQSHSDLVCRLLLE